MRQADPSLTPLEKDVIEIAREAGLAILAIYEDAGRFTSAEALKTLKDDDSPLTHADITAHHIISSRLKILTPGIPLVSEEDASSLAHRTQQGDFWLIDPLDGTKEFLSRNGEFTVNIALIRDGAPVLGVVYTPVTRAMYSGTHSHGAFCEIDGAIKQIHVSTAPKAGDKVRVVASRNHLNAETISIINDLGEHELIQAGSSLKFCVIAEGKADFYPRLAPTCEWDTAAAQVIVEAAGGVVTMLDGTPLRYGKSEILNPHFIAASVPWASLKSRND